MKVEAAYSPHGLSHVLVLEMCHEMLNNAGVRRQDFVGGTLESAAQLRRDPPQKE